MSTAGAKRADRAVWSALADQTRRAILDLLRKRPRTTGELAGAFPVSRFAVMKHLTVLERAGLVVVRRQGRERWNHLNVVPIQHVYERWVTPYQALWASKLSAFTSRIEQTDMTDHIASNVLRIELETSIAAPPDVVWRALVADTHEWWPRDFYVNAKARGFRFEPRLGGRMFEDWGDGSGVVWYEVFAINPGVSVDLHGCLAVPYGPAHSLLHLELVAGKGKTILKVSDSTIGVVGDRQQKADGWRQIFEAGLKTFVERAN